MSASTITALVEPSTMSHRRQPVRQARTNPPRHGGGARMLGGSAPDAITPIEEPPGFYPGIQHFTDSIGALPKEMVRQFTMLKEVDAKVCRPEETLKKLVGEMLQKPPVPRQQPVTYPVPVAKVAGRASFAQPATPQPEEQYDPHRRELSYQLRMVLTNMNHTMDEKTHVMTAATDALQKLLARCESSWPQIEDEISEETRLGNPNHRALDNEAAPEKKPSAVGERPRREAAMSHAHAGIGDEMRGTSRKGRAQQVDSDFDEPRPKAKAKNRKHELQNNVGLGIVNGAGPNKRRKVEKGAAGSAAMDRAASLQGSNRQTAAGNPSHTANSETVKKRARGNAMAGAVGGRKRAGTANSNTNSPGNASSPVMGNFAAAPRGGHSGALGAAMQRTSSSRARQNSATGAAAPVGGAASKDANSNGSTEPTSHPKNGETKAAKAEEGSADRSGRSVERSTAKKEDPKHRPPAISTVARNNGRTSKHNTPLAAAFPPEATRPRSGRTVNPPASFSAENPPAPPKRSHKKGAGLAAQQQKAAEAAIARAAEVEEGEDEEADENEPRYCYCGGVSYGEMVACDGPSCAHEWFHLDCAGLSKAPKNSEKWFCRDCQPKTVKAR